MSTTLLVFLTICLFSQTATCFSVCDLFDAFRQLLGCQDRPCTPCASCSLKTSVVETCPWSPSEILPTAFELVKNKTPSDFIFSSPADEVLWKVIEELRVAKQKAIQELEIFKQKAAEELEAFKFKANGELQACRQSVASLPIEIVRNESVKPPVNTDNKKPQDSSPVPAKDSKALKEEREKREFVTSQLSSCNSTVAKLESDITSAEEIKVALVKFLFMSVAFGVYCFLRLMYLIFLEKKGIASLKATLDAAIAKKTNNNNNLGTSPDEKKTEKAEVQRPTVAATKNSKRQRAAKTQQSSSLT